MMKKIDLTLRVLILLCLNSAIAQDKPWKGARPDGHAPISVMGDHAHNKGGFMFSYRYMPMWMEDNFQSKDPISSEGIHQDFMVAPQQMQMNMHMLGVMYAPSDNVTLMLMGNYITKSMDLRTRMGVDFTTESGGIGDVNLSGLIKLFNKNGKSLLANIGVSIPTGDIDQRDATPMMNDTQLAYPMQLGSGTWDPSGGFTYLGQSDNLSWGAQSKYKFRIGENSENYTFGNQLDMVGWGAIRVSDYLGVSTSLSYFNIARIEGVDADLNPMMMPLFDAANSGRSQLDFGVGINFYVPKDSMKNFRLAGEVKLPAYQKVRGIQMKNTLTVLLGVQYAIGHKH